MSEDIKGEFLRALDSVSSTSELEEIRVRYLGKKGILTERLRLLGSMPSEERAAFGKEINELKEFISDAISKKRALLKEAELRGRLSKEFIDITLPGRYVLPGRAHPISQCLEDIIEIFTSMGFGIEEGPEVELDRYNFEMLNIPKEHPARDMQDTFYISEDVVLRTHTSPVQVRVMERSTPPLRFVAPGKVYRCDADVSHTPMFHQVEGLMVEEGISMSHLKGVLETFIHRFFGPGIPVRFRPSFFPFTETSAEVDMGCIFCSGSGCSICKGTGWIEVLGAGMVNPRVFEMVGYDPARYTGFAFGMGVERLTMLRYSIDDIRAFYENDIRFLRQF